MTALLVASDLRQACPSLAHFPGDRDALEPLSTVSTGATLRADYECPCGERWSCWWSAGDPWPACARSRDNPRIRNHPRKGSPMEPVNWRKPLRSYSSGGCVEAANWRTSKRSNGNSMCLEAADTPAGVLVRDTKQAGQSGRTVLAYPAAAWRAFVADPEGALR